MRKFISIVILLFAAVAFNGQLLATARPAVENRIPERGPSVSVDKGYIELSAPEAETVKFEIFSITGQLIKAVTVKSSTVKVELPKGFYIIKCDSWTKRVMLR
ncbi:MAG: T9SS type A sorting domain-containing protein [Bacteroidales bacterium]|nr:T9SS type A sorting domain-containing protein [Bacteroidales bacterium]